MQRITKKPWLSATGRKMAKQIQSAFIQATLEVEGLFALDPALKTTLRTKTRSNPDTPVTARSFVALWFGIDREAMNYTERSHVRLLNILKSAELNLLNHISLDVTGTSGIGFRLSLSGLPSADTGNPVSVGEPEKAVFTIRDFCEELRLAGVTPYLIHLQNLSRDDLPNSVADLFSVRSPVGDMPDSPLFLFREFLTYLDGANWKELQALYRQRDKKGYSDRAVTLLKNFYKIVRERYGLSISENDICSHCDICTGWIRCTQANGTRPALNHKEKTLLQLSKPLAWVSKRRNLSDSDVLPRLGSDV